MKNLKKWLWLLPLLACALSSMQCKKNKVPIPLTELEKLPAITQTGANTFGCLVDGVAWLPNGTKPQNGGKNIELYVDPTFQGGRFAITGHQYKFPDMDISIGSANCTSTGFFDYSNSQTLVSFYKTISGSLPCEIGGSNNSTFKNGFLNITRYDLTTGIFSGTFELKLYNPQSLCGDTIKITNGRFDVKL